MRETVIQALLIGARDRSVDQLSESCLALEELKLKAIFSAGLTTPQLIRELNAHAPEVVLLEIDPQRRAYQTALDIRIVAPDTRIIGFAQFDEGGLAQEAAQFCVEDVLIAPFEAERTVAALRRRPDAEAAPTGRFAVFQSATGGAGATTTAFSVAVALATSWRRRTLYIDCDLHSSPLPFWLEIKNAPSLADALETTDTLEPRRWARAVHRFAGVDILLAPSSREESWFSPWDFLRLLSFASLRYGHIVIDLPEVPIEEFAPAREIADRCYVVCRPDFVSAVMARRRIDEMERSGVDSGRIAVVVNKSARLPAERADLERIVRRPVEVEIPADRRCSVLGLRASVLAGRPLIPAGIRLLAEAVAGAEPPERRSGFSEAALLLKRSFARIVGVSEPEPAASH